MKCARCAHQWKLTPADALPDDDEAEAASPPPSEPQRHGRIEPEAAATAGFASAGPNDAAPEQSHFSHDAPAYEENAETPADEEDWSPPPDDRRPPMSALSQPVVTATHDDAEEEAVQPAFPDEEESAALQGRRSWWKRGQPASGRGQTYPTPSGAYEVPVDDDEGDVPHAHVAESAAFGKAETPAPAADASWSSRFMGPAWKTRGAKTAVEEEEDEDPETIIRETFRSALERTEEEPHPAADAADDGQDASPFGSIYDAEWNRSGDEDSEVQAGGRPGAGFRQPQADYEDEDTSGQFAATGHGALDANEEPQSAFYTEEVEERAPAFLRRGARSDEPEPGETYRTGHDEYGAYDEEEDQQDDRATIGRFAPQTASFDEPDGRSEDFDDAPNALGGSAKRRGYDSVYGDQFDDAADRRNDENGLGPLMGPDDEEDEDRDTDDIYGPAPRGSSGLAVAAGWVAYLSLAGGLVLGAINFRQDVMAALPGTVNLYRMLGYEVALNKVDFASVDYQWNEIDGRPAIELRGEVVNVTDETVRVPPVVVNVQSSSGANLVAEASVPTDELGPRDSATFTLELVSPPEDVTRIELEFAPGG